MAFKLDAFVYFTQIVEIDFSNNKLERIPNQIGHLSTLTVLKLSSNRIEKVLPTLVLAAKGEMHHIPPFGIVDTSPGTPS